MFTRIPSMALAARALAATAICGAVALGTGGAAFATTPTASHSTPVTARHVTCARATKAMARINKAEATISARLPKLEAAESRLTTKGHTKLAARVEKRIQRLQTANGRLGGLATKIQAKCPTSTTS